MQCLDLTDFITFVPSSPIFINSLSKVCSFAHNALMCVCLSLIYYQRVAPDRVPSVYQGKYSSSSKL